MNTPKKYYNLIISVAALTLIATIILFVFYNEGSPLGPYFQIFAVYMVLQKVGLASGILLLLLRLFKLLKNRASFLYIFCTTLNIGLALLGITIYFLGYANLAWLAACLLNLLVGFLMLVDIFILEYLLEEVS